MDWQTCTGVDLRHLASALLSNRRWRLDEILLIALALWSGLSHVRFLDFTAIICVPILAPRLELFPPYDAELDKPWLNAAIILAAVMTLVHFFPPEAELQQKVDNEYPVAALNYMRQHQINGKIFSPAEYGGFIEWTAPEFKSFADGRAVFVEKGIFDDCFSALTIREPYQVLDKYQIDYVLIREAWPTELSARAFCWLARGLLRPEDRFVCSSSSLLACTAQSGFTVTICCLGARPPRSTSLLIQRDTCRERARLGPQLDPRNAAALSSAWIAEEAADLQRRATVRPNPDTMLFKA